jgi:hypothetical protein
MQQRKNLVGYEIKSDTGYDAVMFKTEHEAWELRLVKYHGATTDKVLREQYEKVCRKRGITLHVPTML